MAQRVENQVTKVVSGVTWYGWRPVGDTSGDPSAEYWTTSTVVPDGYKVWLMNESAYGTYGSANAGRWAVCPTCQSEFPRSKMIPIGGKFYCLKNGCAQEKLHDAESDSFRGVQR